MAENRRVGVAVDFSPCSKKALKWAIDNIVRNGDHLIVVNIQPQAFYEDGEMQLWETTGSPLIPLNEFSDPAIMKKYHMKTDAETLAILNASIRQKEITVLVKICWGDPRAKLCEAINSIPLSCLVIGNRGHGLLEKVIIGSVSDYLVSHADCPITLVKQRDE